VTVGSDAAPDQLEPIDADGELPSVDRAGGRRRLLREIRAIATQEALDGMRDRRQLLVRTLTPVVLFLCVLAVSIGLGGTESRTHPDPYTVAVEGDYEGAVETLSGLSDRLTFIPVGDARLAAIDQTELGMRIPDGVDATRRDDPGAVIPIEIFQVGINPPSRAGSLVLQSSLADLEYATASRLLEEQQEASGTRSDSITLTVKNVERSEAGTRTLVSQVIPGLVCLQAALLIAGTANRIVSRRSRGLLMAQLLLPVSRRSLAIAKGLGELVIGCVTAAPVILAVLGFGAVAAVFTEASTSIGLQLLATAITMVVLFAFTTALGVVIGTTARTQEQVSLATGAAVIAAALIAVTVAISNRPPPRAIAVVPVAGSIGSLRDVLEGSGSLAAVLVASATTALATFAVGAFTGRSLDAERMVVRSG
jgi:ABC-type transport system involved in multi-copper enzyme maturation permease subunit